METTLGHSTPNGGEHRFCACLLARQPTIRPGSASATALEFLHNKSNHVGFTKLLFQITLIHCAMVSFISLAFIFKLLKER